MCLQYGEFVIGPLEASCLDKQLSNVIYRFVIETTFAGLFKRVLAVIADVNAEGVKQAGDFYPVAFVDTKNGPRRDGREPKHFEHISIGRC